MLNDIIICGVHFCSPLYVSFTVAHVPENYFLTVPNIPNKGISLVKFFFDLKKIFI